MVSDGEAGAFGTTIGEQLRAAREGQGLSLAEVAERTRVPTRHLQAIELSDHAGLPAPTYSAGFVRAYARLLGLDGQRLSQEFRAEMGAATVVHHQHAPYEPADPRRTPPAGLALVLLLIAVVGALGYLYWRGSTEHPAEIAAGPIAAVPAAPAARPGTPAPASAPAPAPGGTVVIGASEDVWVKVTDGGKTLFMGILKPADHFQVPAGATAPLLTTGRPGNTTITVGATPIPTVGDPDRAARNVSLKADALLARVAAPPPAVQPAPGAPTPVDNGAT